MKKRIKRKFFYDELCQKISGNCNVNIGSVSKHVSNKLGQTKIHPNYSHESISCFNNMKSFDCGKKNNQTKNFPSTKFSKVNIKELRNETFNTLIKLTL